MKKIVLVLLSLVLAVLACDVVAAPTQSGVWDTEVFDGAGDFYLSRTYKVEDGSYTWTNSFEKPFALGAIEAFHPASGTFTTTVSRVRVVKYNQYQGNVVTTNLFGGVETNYMFVVTNSVSLELTNQLCSAITTNDAHVTLQEGTDFPYGVYVLGGDKIVVTCSTNDTYFIFTGRR
jgi:hypothetical protein